MAEDFGQAGGQRKAARERSTISFPYGDLENGIKVAHGVHRVGGTSCQWEQLAAELKMASTGGGFRAVALTAKLFGLITYSKAAVQLTDLGARTCDAAREAQARVDAFLTVPLYSGLYEKFKATTLPPDLGLESEMVALGVVKKQAPKARQAFLRSAEQAGFFKYGKNRLVLPSAGAAENEMRRNAAGDGKLGESSGQNDATADAPPDFFGGLMRKLPPEGREWPTASRFTWIQAANAIFDLLYPKPEGDEARIRIEIEGSDSPVET